MCYNCIQGPMPDEYILRPEKKIEDDKLWEQIRFWESYGKAAWEATKFLKLKLIRQGKLS